MTVRPRGGRRRSAATGGPAALVAGRDRAGARPRARAGAWMVVGARRDARHHRRRPARIHGDRRGAGDAGARRGRARPSTSRSARRSASAAAGAPCSRWRGSTRPAGSALEAAAERERRALPAVYIFGAGHVGRALAAALALLPVRPVLVDQRAEELAHGAGRGRARADAAARGGGAARRRPGAAFVVLTHDHALDFLIAREALARGDAAYVGMIGSRTKRVSFERWLARDDGAGRHRRARLPDRRGRAAGQAAGGDRGLRRRRRSCSSCAGRRSARSTRS